MVYCQIVDWIKNTLNLNYLLSYNLLLVLTQIWVLLLHSYHKLVYFNIAIDYNIFIIINICFLINVVLIIYILLINSSLCFSFPNYLSWLPSIINWQSLSSIRSLLCNSIDYISKTTLLIIINMINNIAMILLIQLLLFYIVQQSIDNNP